MPKALGKCPFCENKMIPEVIEHNSLRRDKCKCTECGNIIYICRAPSCKNYAKGSKFYDEEFCPDCIASFFSAGSGIANAGAKAAMSVVAGFVVKQILDKK